MKYSVIFDMDGLIFDSEVLSKQCWRRAAPAFGIDAEVLEPVMIAITGMNGEKTRQILDEYFARYPKYTYDALRGAYEEEYRRAVERGELRLKPGVFELLRALRDRAGIALASSTRREKILSELELFHLTPCFDVILGGDQVKHSKPNPEIFDLALEALNGDKAHAFVIEDSYNGIHAAAAGGFRPLMVPDLLPATEEMQSICEAVLSDLFAVQRYILQVMETEKMGEKA